MPVHAVRKPCPYCDHNVELVPPFESGSRLTFVTPCPREVCDKQLLVLALRGRVTTIHRPRKFRLANRMRDESEAHRQVALLAEEACESAYLHALRAAAVTLRVACQLFAASVIFGDDPNAESTRRMRPMIDQLEGKHPPGDLPEVRRREVATSLRFVTRLGDTAAHPNVPADWRLQPIPSNVADGIAAAEKLVANTMGWPL